MRINAHLHFAGQCREAIEFYAACLGGRVNVMMTYGETPAAQQVPADFADRIIHATLELDEDTLTAADVPPDRYHAPSGFSLIVRPEGVEETERVFGALSAGGEVVMPLQQTFWTRQFGILKDRFGVTWMLQCADG